MIKEYFANIFLHSSDVTIDLEKNKIKVLGSKAEPWKVTLIDTGLNTMTGGRIKRIKNYIADNTFMLTYGDGVSNVNIKKLVEFHKKKGKLATVTAVKPYARFGALALDDKHNVLSFREKPQGDGDWVNGGFFVLEPGVFDYIKNDESIWEKESLEQLSTRKQLNAYKHGGFWKCMDTLRDKVELDRLWRSDEAPWKIWK